MRPGPKRAELTLGSEQQEQLESVAVSTSMAQGLVMRARMILCHAEGVSNAAVAAKVGASPQAVGKRRRRFLGNDVEGRHDELRPGRPRTLTTRRCPRLSTGHCNRSPMKPRIGAYA